MCNNQTANTYYSFVMYFDVLRIFVFNICIISYKHMTVDLYTPKPMQ